MNKFCTLGLLLLTCLVAGAQTPVMDVKPSDYKYQTVINVAPTQNDSRHRKIKLEEGQYLLGNSLSDEYDAYGSAPYKGDVLVGCVLYNSSYQHLKNCRALGIRFCLPSDCMIKNVTYHGHSIDNAQENTVKPIGKVMDAGWNYVKFDKPIPLDPEGSFLSYTYVQEDNNYGICNWPDKAAGGFWIYLFNQDTQKWTWGNFSAYYGAVCIQLVVEAEVPDYNVTIEDVDCNPAAANQMGRSVLYLKSNSKKAIESLDYTVTIDGKTSEFHRSFTTPVPSGLNQVFGVEVGYSVPAKAGVYPTTFNLTKINGEAVEIPTTTQFDQKVYTRLAARRTVVEEFTGTGCGWCPRGWVGMEYLKKEYGDKFIGIAVHQYNDSDPMLCKRYCNPGFGGAPSCVIDRKQACDPYQGTGYGIDSEFEYFNDIAPEVDVTVSGTYSSDMKKVTAKADIEFLTDTNGKYTVAFALTGDGLTGKTAAWRQTNYYANQAEDVSGVASWMPDLAKFCSGNEWGKSPVQLTFNDVLLTSSYSTTGTNSVTALGSKYTAGATASKSCTLTLPTSTVLLAALDYEEVYVVAMVIDPDGKMANAARARVGTPEGIGTVLAPATFDTQAYDLSGRVAGSTTTGITIQNGKKYIAR